MKKKSKLVFLILCDSFISMIMGFGMYTWYIFNKIDLNVSILIGLFSSALMQLILTFSNKGILEKLK